MKRERMRYSRYKDHYADCATTPGSYDKVSKTIEVIIPDGRMKPSGVRGERFFTYQIEIADDSRGKTWYSPFRAVCKENALKQCEKWCKENGWRVVGMDYPSFVR